MPIIDIQRRLREAGRIRIGEAVPATSKNGKPITRPKRLEAFRFTSADRASIERVAELYGGEAREWDGAPVGEQWEVFTKASEIPVIVPPVELAWSQWYELWSGGGCQRRCDGQRQVDGSPCACDPEERRLGIEGTCDAHSRLSLILADLDGIGTWRLDTQGWYAAGELKGAMELVAMIQSTGRLVQGRLLLTERSVKRPNQPTKTFVVPGLDIERPFAALEGGPVRAGLTPIAPSDAPALSVGSQVEAFSGREAPPRRSNAAEPIPAIDLEPGAAFEPDLDVAPDSDDPEVQRMALQLRLQELANAMEPDERTLCRDVLVEELGPFGEMTVSKLRRACAIAEAWPDEPPSAGAPFGEDPESGEPIPPPPPGTTPIVSHEPGSITDAKVRRIQILFRGQDISDRGLRLSHLERIVGREVTSTKALSQAEALVVIAELEKVRLSDGSTF